VELLHADRMGVVDVLAEVGGVSTRAGLVALCPRIEVDRALRSGEIVADARGRYALPIADEALRAAHRLTGVVSHLSAALYWGVGTQGRAFVSTGDRGAAPDGRSGPA
jgi:hypothetical protein